MVFLGSKHLQASSSWGSGSPDPGGYSKSGAIEKTHFSLCRWMSQHCCFSALRLALATQIWKSHYQSCFLSPRSLAFECHFYCMCYFLYGLIWLSSHFLKFRRWGFHGFLISRCLGSTWNSWFIQRFLGLDPWTWNHTRLSTIYHACPSSSPGNAW